MEISIEQIRENLKRIYNYTAGSIRPVQGGTVGYTFSVDDVYFLKIYDDRLAITQRCVEHLTEQLTVLDILQNRTELRGKVCYPVRTSTGDLFYTCGVFTGVLFNYIPGGAVGFGNPYFEEDIRQLTEIVRALHRIAPVLFEALCPKESYDLRWCTELNWIIREETRNMPLRFAETVCEYAKIVEAKIREACALTEELKAAALPFVLCHTDIHPGNVMRDPNGKLYLVDWENVQLAPKEADLYSFSEKEDLAHLAERADETAMLYYTVRRDLEDIYEFLRSVLNHEFSADEEDEVYGHVCRILLHLANTK